MKSFIMFTLASFFSFQLLAQGPSLTKEETVNYIETKISEAQGKFMHDKYDDGSIEKEYFFDISMYLDENNILNINFLNTSYSELVFYWKNKETHKIPCDFYVWDVTNSFKPSDIKEIVKVLPNKTGDPVGYIEVSLKFKTASQTFEYWDSTTERGDYVNCDHFYKQKVSKFTENYVKIPYFANDPTNFDKIKKALLYLKELCDAEEDPFGD